RPGKTDHAAYRRGQYPGDYFIPKRFNKAGALERSKTMSTQRIDDTVMENIEILAKLSMSEDEREEMRTELEKILDYVEKLNELDTENVEAASHIFPLENVFREDEVTNGDAQEEMLANAPVKKEGQYQVPKTV